MNNPPSMKNILGAVGALAPLFLATPAAHAFDANGVTLCYQTAPLWNAPDGSVVTTTSDGPIADVLQAVGETRTHLMFAHTNVGWVTQSTTLKPSHRNDADVPLEPGELARGYPGFSQTNMGGAFAYISGVSDPHYHFPPPPERTYSNFGVCGDRCQAQATSTYIWQQIPYTTEITFGSEVLNAPVPFGGSSPIYGAPSVTPPPPPLFNFYLLGSYNDGSGSGNFVHFPYEFHQYFYGPFRTWGSDRSQGTSSGIVCSEVPAYGWAQWAMNTQPKLPPEATSFQWNGHPAIMGHSYPAEDTQAAAYALWNSVYSQCNGNFGFWEDVGAYFLGFDGPTYCSHMANQVVRCFWQGTADGSCSDNTYGWAVTSGAYSLSPDVLVGYHQTPEWAGPWSHAPAIDLQWNGAGSYYGCWD